MYNISEILKRIDWKMPEEVQKNGRILAIESGLIQPFIQPLTEEFNKNVWGNCALVIATKQDSDLKEHLLKLLEWLQDMNWPGAASIFERLRAFSDSDMIIAAIESSIQIAADDNDDTWAENLTVLKKAILTQR